MTRLNWIVATLLVLPAWAHAHDYPTVERVLFVQACMRDHPGGYYEMLNKCSCVMDTIARDVPFEQFEEMSTVAKATSIGGERGSYIRDAEPLQVQVRKFRQLQAKARQSCMIAPDAPR
jgi:hypothetical protein